MKHSCNKTTDRHSEIERNRERQRRSVIQSTNVRDIDRESSATINREMNKHKQRQRQRHREQIRAGTDMQINI